MSLELYTWRVPKEEFFKCRWVEDVLSIDADFTDNLYYFRSDTRLLGFDTEAQRIASEMGDLIPLDFTEDVRKGISIYEAYFVRLLNINNFVVQSSYYNSYGYKIIETKKEIILVLAVNTN